MEKNNERTIDEYSKKKKKIYALKKNKNEDH